MSAARNNGSMGLIAMHFEPVLAGAQRPGLELDRVFTDVAPLDARLADLSKKAHRSRRQNEAILATAMLCGGILPIETEARLRTKVRARSGARPHYSRHSRSRDPPRR